MLEQKMIETKQEVFWKYAKSCICCTEKNKEICQKLQEYRQEKITPSWEILETAFPNAFKQYKKFTETYQLDFNSPETVRRFWLEFHNTYAPKPCHVLKGQINEITYDSSGNPIYKINYNNSEKKVSGELMQKAEKGDKISAHLGFAIEKLTK